MQPILRDHPQDPDAESGEAYLCLRENDFACAIDMDLRRSSQMPHEAAEIEDQMAHALTGLGGDSLEARGMAPICRRDFACRQT
jgi:hypothetical protein